MIVNNHHNVKSTSTLHSFHQDPQLVQTLMIWYCNSLCNQSIKWQLGRGTVTNVKGEKRIAVHQIGIIMEYCIGYWLRESRVWDSEHTFQLNEALKPVGFNVTLICPTQATRA